MVQQQQQPFEILIDGQKYPCLRWETVSSAETLEETWEGGWTGGMGEFTRRSRNRYFIGSNMDMTSYPYARLRKSIAATITNGTTIAKADQPFYVFVASADSTNHFAYVVGREHSVKIDLTDNAIEETHDFTPSGSAAVVGRPVFFEGQWRIPLGVNQDAISLAAITTTTGDTWTDFSTSDKALHFALMQDEATAKLWMADATSGNENRIMSTANVGTAFAPVAGSGFEVGDSSEGITDLLNASGQLLVSKPSAPWFFDQQGVSRPAIEFIGRNAELNSSAGACGWTHGPYAYWPHSSGLWRIFGDRADSVDFASDPNWASASLDSVIPSFFGGADQMWTSFTAWGHWCYATLQTDLFQGYIREDGRITWHGIMINSAQSLRCQITHNPETAAGGPILWVIDDSSTPNLFRIDLDADGSTRDVTVSPGTNRGVASEDGRFYLPSTDFGRPEQQKQLRMAWLTADDWDSEVTGSLRIHRDRAATSELIGSTFTSVTNTAVEQAWTPGTNDTFREARLQVLLSASASYAPATNDIKIRALGMRAVTPHVYKATIPLTGGDLRGFSAGITGALSNLRNLKKGKSIAVLEPAENATFTGYVEDVQEKVLAAERQNPQHVLEVFIRRWVL